MHSGPFTMLPPERHFQEAVSISEQGWHLESPTINPNRALCTHLYLTAGVSVPQGSGLPGVGYKSSQPSQGLKKILWLPDRPIWLLLTVAVLL